MGRRRHGMLKIVQYRRGGKGLLEKSCVKIRRYSLDVVRAARVPDGTAPSGNMTTPTPARLNEEYCLSETQLPVSAEELQRAFSLFNEASGRLADAYRELEQQVERLTVELEVANGALRQQYREKAALSLRLSSLLDALPGGVVVLDEFDVVIDLNPAARLWLGEAVMGIPWRDVEAFHLQPTGTEGEWHLRQVQRRVNLTAGTRGEESGRVLLLTDITQAHELQEQLQRHKRLSSMGEMAAGLAHQLRTPLATAILYAGNLNREALAEVDRRRFAHKALERLRALEHMIQDMLLFVRGVPSLDGRVDVRLMLADAMQAVEPQVIERGLSMHLESAHNLPELHGNAKALTGIVVNLLENAMQACSHGARIALRAGVEGAEVVVDVRDDGPGMEAAVLDRLFEPFFTTRAEGTGLGLAIVQAVIQAHGGRVGVSSEVGRGSCFTLRFPLSKEAVAK